jgi:hypothetical protein
MKNKKGVGFGTMATVLALLGVFVILVVFVTRGLVTVEHSGRESVCQLSAWANCLEHAGTLGMSSFGLKCPTKLKTITMADLEEGKSLAKKEMAALAVDFKGLIGKNKYVTNSPSNDLALEFVLNKIVAEGMKTCWEDFRGVPCLFSRWWSPFCNTKQKDCGGIIERLRVWDSERVPSYCVICERIKFDDEIKKKFRLAIPLNKWMEVNEVSAGVSYAEYLKDDVGSLNSYSVAVQHEPLAIVFGKVNLDFFNSYFKYIINPLFGEKAVLKDTRSLILVSYENVGAYCMYIEG